MAVLASPRCRFVPLRRNQWRRINPRCSSEIGAGKAEKGAALVWFKRDLRLDDHPGLVLAVNRHPTVIPVYVFDPRLLRCYDDDLLEVLLFSLKDLRKALKDQGSDLFLAFGDASDEIMKLANQVKASHIFAEEELEYNFRTVTCLVKSSLDSTLFSWGKLEFSTWETPLYDIKSSKGLPTSYKKFKQLKIPINAPVSQPLLPSLLITLPGANIPTIESLKEYLSSTGSLQNESWASIKRKPASYVLSLRRAGQSLKESIPEASKSSISSSKNTPQEKPENSVFLSRNSNVVRGGTDVVLNGFAAYLRYLEGTARGDWQEVHDKLRFTESRVGASFGALFGAALLLGVISRRRVHYEALKYEKERNGGSLSPFGYSIFTVSAAVNAAESMEWYWMLAMKSQLYEKGRYSVRIWNWNGNLIQYIAVGKEGPAVLMVHGFGAFSEHYRDNISAVADEGHRVWAITLLGFGRSEKPNVRYTELLWADLIRDFIVDVIGEPAHLIGNSIGGYFVALVAGLWPELAKTVVLMNTAGSVIPGYSVSSLIEEIKPSGVAWLGSRLLLAYLKLRAERILKNFYPTDPTRVDEPLLQEMLRASEDPGVLIVLEGVFNFTLGIPLNYLLTSFGGKALIIQGIKDPLLNAQKRLAMIRDHCKGVIIQELDAGHCPHDEQPKLVNAIIKEWAAASSAVSSY